MSGRWAMEPLASIRLADAAACDASGLLPRRGRLTFWFDMEEQPDGILPEDRSGFRVTYTADDVAPLERRSPPALTWAKRKPNDSLAACRLSFAPGLSLPVWDQLPADLMERIDSLRYTDLMCDLDGDAIHRLLGYPMVLHRAVEPICQYASNGLRCGSADSLDEDRARAMEEGIADWILLLQLDTDEDEGPGWMWGDAGVLHYSIRRQDLAQSRFDGCWLTWECC